jgi:hypothetical protein
MNVKLIMAVVREHVWTHGHHSSVNVMMGTLWQQMGAVVKIWMSVLWAHIVASSSVSTVMDLMAVTVKRAMPSTVMEEHAGFPVVGTTQPTMAASTLLAGQPTTLWTSAASGTSTQNPPPQTLSSLSPSTTPTMAYTEQLHARETISSFMMVAPLLVGYQSGFVALQHQAFSTLVRARQ